MPTQTGELGVTFPDNTLQTTAAIAGAPGFGGFRNMSVYTITSFWVVPAGVTACKVTVVGGGGGSSQINGAGGGTSSFGSFCSATGGVRGFNATGGTGGIGVGGTLNIRGSYAISGSPGGGDSFASELTGGDSIFGNASYGAGGLGFWQNAGGAPAVIAGGGAGGTAIRIISGLTTGTSINVTVGAAGTGSSTDGYPGVVIVEY